MKLETVSAVLEMPAESIPLAIEARIVKLYERKTSAASPKKPSGGSNQKGVLGELDGKATIEVVFWDCPLISAPVGARIHLVCEKGKRGFTGLKRMDNEWKGKTTPQVFVYDRAAISFPDSDNDAPNEAATPAESMSATQTRQPAQSARQQAPASEDAASETRVHFGKLRQTPVSELTNDAFAWFAREWMPKKEANEAASEDDLKLIAALKKDGRYRAPQPAPTKQAPVEQEAAPAPLVNAYDGAHDRIAQNANLQALCLHLVNQTTVPQWAETYGVPMTQEQIGEFAMNLIIDAQRRGEGRNMPTTVGGIIPASVAE